MQAGVHDSRHIDALFQFGDSRRDSGPGTVQEVTDVTDPSLPHGIEHSQTLEEFCRSGDIFHLVSARADNDQVRSASNDGLQ